MYPAKFYLYRNVFGIVASLLSLAVTTDAALAATCKTTVLQWKPPARGTHIALQSFSYCGGTLNATAYVKNEGDDNVVTLYFTDGQNQSTPLSTIALDYVGHSTGSDFELWKTSTPVYYDGIKELLNITYQALGVHQVYYETLDMAVTRSGAPAPIVPSLPPPPYALPQGFGDDITDFLAVKPGSESEIALTQMLLNINPARKGAAPGVVVAAGNGPSYPIINLGYQYNWVRDSSLTMDVIQKLYTAATTNTAKRKYANILFQYATARAMEQTDPDLQTGLGEPKFYLNNSLWSGLWSRPQNDGPATSASTLIDFANSYLSNGGSIEIVKQQIYDSTKHPDMAPVQKDLLFVASNWTSPSYDIWEAVSSRHFYNGLVSRRALAMGTAFAYKMGDLATGAKLAAAERAVTSSLNQFWDAERQIIMYEYGPVLRNKSSYLDTAVILGLVHGYNGDGVFGWINDQVLSTAVRLATSFIDICPLANKTRKTAAGVMGIPIGRFPEDTDNSTGRTPDGGNPWYVCTASFAQFMYSASSEYSAVGTLAVSRTSVPFFRYFAPSAEVEAGKTCGNNTRQFRAVIESLNGWGDAFFRTIQHYTPADGSLTEEFNRITGTPQGAGDLT